MSNEKSLVSISLEMGEILSQVAENGGELSEVLEQAFDVSGAELAVKADHYAMLMDRLELESDFWKQKADSYLKVSRSCKALKERLNTNIKAAMQIMSVDEIAGEEMRFKLSRSNPKLLIDDTALPESWKMQVVEYVADKKRITEALDLGDQIPGAKFEASYSLRKYINARKK